MDPARRRSRSPTPPFELIGPGTSRVSLPLGVSCRRAYRLRAWRAPRRPEARSRGGPAGLERVRARPARGSRARPWRSAPPATSRRAPPPSCADSSAARPAPALVRQPVEDARGLLRLHRLVHGDEILDRPGLGRRRACAPGARPSPRAPSGRRRAPSSFFSAVLEQALAHLELAHASLRSPRAARRGAPGRRARPASRAAVPLMTPALSSGWRRGRRRPWLRILGFLGCAVLGSGSRDRSRWSRDRGSGRRANGLRQTLGVGPRGSHRRGEPGLGRSSG